MIEFLIPFFFLYGYKILSTLVFLYLLCSKKYLVLPTSKADIKNFFITYIIILAIIIIIAVDILLPRKLFIPSNKLNNIDLVDTTSFTNTDNTPLVNLLEVYS